MEYIIIGILILLVVLVTISLFKNINEGNITERLGKLENNVTRDLYDFKNDINKNLNEDINALNDKIELRLNMINDKVNERLDENFEKTNKTFTSVLERLSKIDEAQKKIDTLSDRETAAKLFKSDVKKHIDAIASKYIIEGVTSDQAIMFLPAEAIFAELNAYHSDIIEYAYKKRVWITSPTTLMSTLTTIEVIIKNEERDKYAKVIRDELSKLSIEFGRYKERWDKLSRSIQTVNKDIEDIHTTTEKITKRFNSINSVELDDKNLIE